MAKNPKSFRMSDRAMENLRWLVDASGANETAVVELALAYLRQGFYSTVEPDLVDIPPAPEEFIVDPSPLVGQGGGHKVRKRKRKHH